MDANTLNSWGKWGLLLLLLLPVVFPGLPTQDGPSHVWIALAMKHLAAQDPLWTASLELAPWHTPNQLIHRFLQMALTLNIPPLWAERLLQFFLLTPWAWLVWKSPKVWSALPLLLLAMNLLFFKGFYNFMAGFVLVYCLWEWLRKGSLPLAIHLLWPLVYFSHPLALGVAGLSLGMYTLSDWKLSSPEQKARRTAALLHGAAWLGLFLWHWMQSDAHAAEIVTRSQSLMERVARLLTGDVFSLSLDARSGVGFLFIGGTFAVAIHRFWHERKHPWVQMLGVVFLLGCVWAMVGPDTLGEGGFVRQRMALVATASAIALLSAQKTPWVGWQRKGVVIGSVAAGLLYLINANTYSTPPPAGPVASTRANIGLHEADRQAVRKDTLSPSNYAIATHHFPVRRKE